VGHGFDRGQDLARIPVDKRMNVPNAEERFRIFVQGDMLMMHCGRRGYGVRIRAK
jgi:hypothetical protein